VRVTITTSGSRGDVQPYVAFGLGLAGAGHDVTIAAPAAFEDLVLGRGLGFEPVRSDPRRVTERMLAQGGGLRNFARNARIALRPALVEMLRAYLRACEDADAIVYTPIGFFGYSLAEALGLPRLGACLQPIFTRTRHFPSAFVPPLPGRLAWSAGSPLTRLYNRASHVATEQALWQAIRRPVNEALEEVGIAPAYPLSGPFARMRREREPGVLAWSPAVLPRPPDWGPEVDVTGFWYLPGEARRWRPPDGLEEFLEAGPRPVCVGFGSMSGTRDMTFERIAEIVAGALERSGRRAVLLGGWGGLDTAESSDRVFAVEDAPHEWLFPRVAAAVHHGGAGAAAASLRAGVPTVTIPFFSDQPFWGSRVAYLGAGPAPLPLRSLSVPGLAAAIEKAVGDHSIRAASRRLGIGIRAEDGVGRAVKFFDRRVLRGGAAASGAAR
jgi:sterol 3beta-glucosyltransferase